MFDSISEPTLKTTPVVTVSVKLTILVATFRVAILTIRETRNMQVSNSPLTERCRSVGSALESHVGSLGSSPDENVLFEQKRVKRVLTSNNVYVVWNVRALVLEMGD